MPSALKHGLILVGVALLSVVLSELILTIVWLPNAPMAVTGNLFWYALIPVQLVVIGIASLLLSAPLKANYKLYIPLYLVIYAAIHAAELNALLNPMEDVLLYIGAIFLSGAIVFALSISRFRTADASA